MNIGSAELLVVLVVALIVLGPKRLPEVARNLGKAMNEVKKVTGDLQNEFHEAIDTTPDPPHISGEISGEVDLRQPTEEKKPTSTTES